VELLCEKSQSSHIPASYVCKFCCEFPRLWDCWIRVFLRRSNCLGKTKSAFSSSVFWSSFFVCLTWFWTLRKGFVNWLLVPC
jgi:hypothetical protein